MAKVTHRVFTTPTFEGSLTQRSLQEKRRKEAESFMNEIGVDRVVSVAENGVGSEFSVVVWFREE